MTQFRSVSFKSFDDFKSVLGDARLIFFHVFEGEPESSILQHFEAPSQGELLLLFDVERDEGFLARTPVTVEITDAPRRFLSKPLIQLRGLGAWAKGTLVDFELHSDRYPELIRKARLFAFGE